MQSVADNAFFENVELSFCMLCLIVFHISASVLIFYGVQTGQVKRFFLPAMGLHIDFASAWQELGIISKDADFVYTPFLTLGVAFYAWRTYEKIPPTYGASASSY